MACGVKVKPEFSVVIYVGIPVRLTTFPLMRLTVPLIRDQRSNTFTAFAWFMLFTTLTLETCARTTWPARRLPTPLNPAGENPGAVVSGPESTLYVMLLLVDFNRNAVP